VLNILFFLLMQGAGLGFTAGDFDIEQSDLQEYAPKDDTVFFFSENFGDGDYSMDPAWKTAKRQSYAPEAPILKVDDGVLKFHQSGAGTCGSNASIEIDLNIPVSSNTKIKFDVKPTYSTVDEGAGWFDVEYPVYIILWITTQNNRLARLMFAYNYRGGESYFEKDNISMAFPSCQQDVWLRDEVFTLRRFYPEAKSVKRVKAGSSGWDYTGYIDNIMIFNDIRDNSYDSVLSRDDSAVGLESGGMDYSLYSKQEKAIEKYKKDLEINSRLGDEKNINRSSYLVGYSYLSAGNYDSAMVDFRRSLDLCRITGENGSMIMTLNKMAEIHLVRDEHDLALETYEQLLSLYEEKKDTVGITISLNKLAEIYFLENKSDLSIEYFKRSLDMRRQTGILTDIAASLESLGNVYSKSGKMQLALDYFSEAIKIYKKEGELNSLA